MHKDTYEPRFTLKLQTGLFFFLGMECAYLIFSMDLASSLVTCLSANSPFPYQSGALKKNKLKITQVLQ